MYCFDASSIVICQNPNFRSKQEKYPAPTRLLMASCIQGSRWGVFSGLGIELTKVSAKAQTSIFLIHHYNCITPWALTGADSAHFQHLLHVCPNFIHHWWGNPSEPLSEGLIINNSDFMFC